MNPALVAQSSRRLDRALDEVVGRPRAGHVDRRTARPVLALERLDLLVERIEHGVRHEVGAVEQHVAGVPADLGALQWIHECLDGLCGEALVHRPWVSLGVGVGVLIGLPLLAVLLFILGSLVGGWWLGLVALAAYAVLLAVGVPVAAVGVGGAILRVFGRPVHVALALFVGLVVLLLVALVPILGAIVILLALLFGLGASTLAIVRGRRPEPAPA